MPHGLRAGSSVCRTVTAPTIADAHNVRFERFKRGQDLRSKGEQIVEVRRAPFQYHQCDFATMQPLLVWEIPVHGDQHLEPRLFAAARS